MWRVSKFFLYIHLKISSWLCNGLPLGTCENIAMNVGRVLTFHEDVIQILKSLTWEFWRSPLNLGFFQEILDNHLNSIETKIKKLLKNNFFFSNICEGEGWCFS